MKHLLRLTISVCFFTFFGCSEKPTDNPSTSYPVQNERSLAELKTFILTGKEIESSWVLIRKNFSEFSGVHQAAPRYRGNNSEQNSKYVSAIIKNFDEQEKALADWEEFKQSVNDNTIIKSINDFTYDFTSDHIFERHIIICTAYIIIRQDSDENDYRELFGSRYTNHISNLCRQ